MLAIMLAFSTSTYAQEGGDPVVGESLFKANCAACHKLDKKGVGPALRGVANKYDREWIYKWVNNSQGFIKSGDAQAVAVFEANNNSVMTSFPGLSHEDIDNIMAYSSLPKPAPKVAETVVSVKNEDSGINQNIIIAALALVFLLLIIMFYLVSKTLSNLKVASGQEVESSPRLPLWKAFVENQFLMLVSSILLLLV